MMLTDLDVAVRKAGLPVVELPGWASRGRPASTGGFNPRGVLCHHTGSTSESRSYAEWMAYTGRSDLPAPLAQLALAGDGTVYVSAAGRSNHAGSCKAFGGWLPAGDGNELLVGIEAFNSGYEGWSDTQLDAYHRLCAALCDHYGWPRSHVLGHGESSTTGKWDPGFNDRIIDMGAFRRGVAAATLGQPQEDDVLNDDDRKWLNERFDRLQKQINDRAQADKERVNRAIRKIDELPDANVTRTDVKEVVRNVFDGPAEPKRVT